MLCWFVTYQSAAIDTDQDATNLQIAIAGLQQLLQQTMTHQQAARESHEETNYDAQSNHSDSTLRSYDPLRDGPLDQGSNDECLQMAEC